ncbi:hypothetical protein GALL_445430 [mine drainage metagenome]|uniref:Uncharacterized protein n=1 Tax=mine drainage metagenome TaxID=410659 RepID=A0A1J5PSM5_9ZZZZ
MPGHDPSGRYAAFSVMTGLLLLHHSVGHDPRAFTEEGMVALGYGWQDVEAALGLPPGYIEVVDFPASEKFRILAREVEPLDLEAIERIARGDLRAGEMQLQFPETCGRDLVDDVAAMMGSDSADGQQPRNAFLGAIMRRINDIESS